MNDFEFEMNYIDFLLKQINEDIQSINRTLRYMNEELAEELKGEKNATNQEER